MTAPQRRLSLDAAMREFRAIVRDKLGDSPAHTTATPMTPEAAEDSRFRFAEHVLSLACPDPRACNDRHCRRNVLCRHLARMQAKRAAGKASHPRRTPAAEAARYAVWVYMSAG